MLLQNYATDAVAHQEIAERKSGDPGPNDNYGSVLACFTHVVPSLLEESGGTTVPPGWCGVPATTLNPTAVTANR
ncbi:hypothetical protein GCM10009555_100330 [Acrocarpospora macrocephala]|uniref:Uncharacterized protein n=1 Tax=Acrocarpospora macrocephala TaxID=150177 RepID=A0A5M3WXX2_9ACTN|nr:hypothetical protein Amac_079340 [Acrocarpospora macrocephala]